MNKENLQMFISVAMGLTLLMGFMAVGGMDAQDEAQANAHYVKMVEGCHWADFKNIVEDVKCETKVVSK